MNSRRYTGAEARALKAKATKGPLTAVAFPPGAEFPHATQVLLPDGHDVAWCELYDHAANAALFAASHDIVESLAAVEAERDALLAAINAHREACEENTAAIKAWKEEVARNEYDTPREYVAILRANETLDVLDTARDAMHALAALRESGQP